MQPRDVESRGILIVERPGSGRGCVVNYSALGGTHALRHNPYLPSVKVEEVSHEMLVLALPSHKMGGRFAFCVTGAILWKRVNARVSFFRGRRSTL